MSGWRALSTPETRKIEKLLRKHFPEHPRRYPPAAYRYNPAAIRVRIVSPVFAGVNGGKRTDLVFPILEKNLPAETWEDVTLVVLLTPEEVKESYQNFRFEHPDYVPV
jgi:stress-induced morphogen